MCHAAVERGERTRLVDPGSEVGLGTGKRKKKCEDNISRWDELVYVYQHTMVSHTML